jgi:protein-S-isoprenylcysteine O-methyltransferase Ste14
MAERSEPNFVLGWVGGIMYVIEAVLTFFLFNHYGLDVLANLGFVLIVIGLVLTFLPGPTLKYRGRPDGSWVETTKLVDSGVYSLVRHPLYVGWGMITFAMMLMSQHPLVIAIGAVILVIVYWSMVDEERVNLEKFGDEYVAYMERVPRANILMGIYRRLRR